jgi:hypothetical protein
MINEMAMAMERHCVGSCRDDGRQFPETLECLFVEGCKVVWEDRNSERRFNPIKHSPQIICKERTWRWEGASRIHNHWLARLDGEEGFWNTDSRIKNAQNPAY